MKIVGYWPPRIRSVATRSFANDSGGHRTRGDARWLEKVEQIRTINEDFKERFIVLHLSLPLLTGVGWDGMVVGTDPPRRNSSFCSRLLRKRVIIALSPRSLVKVEPESYDPSDDVADTEDSRRS